MHGSIQDYFLKTCTSLPSLLDNSHLKGKQQLLILKDLDTSLLDNIQDFNVSNNCLYHQCLSLLKLWVRILFMGWCTDKTLCYKVCHLLSPGTPVSSTNKTDHHNITEILLKVALNTIKPNQTSFSYLVQPSIKINK